jgi:ADP-ribose pyrophosphatase YjhB (NUDIX family)
MAGEPTYCPQCAGRLDSLSRTVEFVCPDCGEHTFLNPEPNARVAVVERRDGGENRLLLVEIDDSGRLSEPPYHDSEWMLPGGHPEYSEQPRDAATRELGEETGLSVDPAALVPIDTVTRWVVPERRGLVVLYAVERPRTAGSPTGEDDASDAQFWTPSALTAEDTANYRELHDEPETYATPEGLLAAAVAALNCGPAPAHSDGGS